MLLALNQEQRHCHRWVKSRFLFMYGFLSEMYMWLVNSEFSELCDPMLRRPSSYWTLYDTDLYIIPFWWFQQLLIFLFFFLFSVEIYPWFFWSNYISVIFPLSLHYLYWIQTGLVRVMIILISPLLWEIIIAILLLELSLSGVSVPLSFIFKGILLIIKSIPLEAFPKSVSFS